MKTHTTVINDSMMKLVARMKKLKVKKHAKVIISMELEELSDGTGVLTIVHAMSNSI